MNPNLQSFRFLFVALTLTVGLSSCTTDDRDGDESTDGNLPGDDVLDDAEDAQVEPEIGFVYDPTIEMIPPDVVVDYGTHEYLIFYYVLVRDLEDSEPSDYGTNGVEIDGIALIHDGTVNYADQVEAIGFGSGETNYTDQNQVLGVPEGGTDGICETGDAHFVSLGGSGGTGGYVIVSFFTDGGDAQEIVDGDLVRVFECGDTVENYDAFIGVGTSISDPNWHSCGDMMSGVAECTVSGLPEIPWY